MSDRTEEIKLISSIRNDIIKIKDGKCEDNTDDLFKKSCDLLVLFKKEPYEHTNKLLMFSQLFKDLEVEDHHFKSDRKLQGKTIAKLKECRAKLEKLLSLHGIKLPKNE